MHGPGRARDAPASASPAPRLRRSSLLNVPAARAVGRTPGRRWDDLRVSEDAQQCGRHPDSEYVELAVEVFSLLADATRVRIVLALREIEELSVNHLADIVDRPSATVSQHLAKMRMARMVSTRQHGQRVFYRLANEHTQQLVADAIFQAEHATSNSPRHHQQAPVSAAATSMEEQA